MRPLPSPARSSANSVQQKSYNWNTLNTKVCKKLGFVIPKAESEAVVNCNPGAIERVLKLVRYKIAKYTGENPDFG